MLPFGRLAYPAVPGEWLTGREAGPCRLLCLWNAFVLSGDAASRSWVLCDWPAQHVERVREGRATLAEDGELPPAMRGQAGPPLLHPLDPRWDYLDEERLWTLALANNTAAGTLYFPLPERPPEEIQRAAEAHEEYGRPREEEEEH